MDPNKFRESREAINRLCDNINLLIDQKALEASKECYEEVNECLDVLRPQAEGKIQKRSVKNLGSKLRVLSTRIKKLKPKKASSKPGKASRILWDEKRVAGLSDPFLKKLLINMGDDQEAQVCFGTSGKGIRPNYQIQFASKEIIAFNGSSHKQNSKLISGDPGKLSPPFSMDVIKKSLGAKGD
ncbi:hypothetical protein [Desulfospira joergensenii]|uniref:hypothetical protein n=1 Tax=Desulfospira joergensenii TaxID=53329 RepID=UPI0003B69A62|nr:hypothetical protein [Desulfospira joergensenii]